LRERVLTKPFNPRDLLGAVAQSLRGDGAG
jgi:DNA-binding response OmpR family regulator